MAKGYTEYDPNEATATQVSQRNSFVAPAPTRPSTMPADAAARKALPIGTGVLDYFPDALLAVAEVSYIGNQQHNPGEPLHWDRSKSKDEYDTMIRHAMERGTRDSDGTRHMAKAAWRALALLQKEIEAEWKINGPLIRQLQQR